ncbi:peroxidase family protein [Jiella endophytica]|nr:peroxidase family protein [Jiella endophytica]
MRALHGMSRFDRFMKECVEGKAVNAQDVLPQIFGYLFEENPITGNLSQKTIIDGFAALVDSMKKDDNADGPAEAGMTFLGQFIDHDITHDATSVTGTRIDPRSIRNVRTPNLDLDCVYGDGPDATPHLYSQKHEGYMLFGRQDNPLDLPRNSDGRALIGDPRNDENIIVSQIQGAFICLHNILMSKSKSDKSIGQAVADCASMGIRKKAWDEVPTDKMRFEQVRRFIRLHYQWLVLNHFLPAFVDDKIVGKTLETDPFHDKGPVMPVEFSVAAYRFGHATVQSTYTLYEDKTVKLFDMLGFQRRGPEATVEMARFFGHGGQKARPVGTTMASTLFELPDNVAKGTIRWDDFEIPEALAKRLALRNILRDRLSLHLVSGQDAARRLGFEVIPAPKALTDHHITKTPLWFYCLQEAQESGKKKLTGVGGSIVASVIIRLLRLDPASVLNTHSFTPWEGFGGDFNMAAMMAYVEKERGNVENKEDLYC